MEELRFKKLHNGLKLSHHPFHRSLLYLKWLFKGIDFKGKKILDVGGGNGIYSYYAKSEGASYCLNLEPFASGSKNVKIRDSEIEDDLRIDTQPHTFQEFETQSKFDVIILHDSINHLDEENFSQIHKIKEAYTIYSRLISKMGKMLSKNGIVVISDCSRINFFGALGIRNPVAPSIDWDIHQHPKILSKLFSENSFDLLKLRWSPFKKFDRFGHLLSRLGFSFSYFLQSHFNLIFRIQNNELP